MQKSNRGRAFRREQAAKKNRRDAATLRAISPGSEFHPQDREWIGRGEKNSKANRSGERWRGLDPMPRHRAIAEQIEAMS